MYRAILPEMVVDWTYERSGSHEPATLMALRPDRAAHAKQDDEHSYE